MPSCFLWTALTVLTAVLSADLGIRIAVRRLKNKPANQDNPRPFSCLRVAFEFPLTLQAQISRKYDVIWPSPIRERSIFLSCHVNLYFIKNSRPTYSDGEFIETTAAGIGGKGAGGIGRGLNGVSGSLDGESFEVQSQRANVYGIDKFSP